MYASVVNVLRSVKITKIDKNVVLSSSSSEESYRIYPITTTELKIYIQLCCCTYTADAVMFLFATNVLCYFQNKACNNAESCTVVIVIARQGIATNITHTHTCNLNRTSSQRTYFIDVQNGQHTPASPCRRCAGAAPSRKCKCDPTPSENLSPYSRVWLFWNARYMRNLRILGFGLSSGRLA